MSVKPSKTIISTLMEKANHGSAESQHELGLMYEKGQDVEQDYGKALELLRKSSQLGNPNARAALTALLKRLSKRERIVVVGNSGVGKKTLINAFLSDISSKEIKMGTGYLAEKELVEYYPLNSNYIIVISDGWENKGHDQSRSRLKDYLARKNNHGCEQGEVIVWYCLPMEGPRLLKSTEVKLIDDVNSSGVPILVVITKGKHFLNGDVRFWTGDSQLFHLIADSVPDKIIGIVLTRAKEEQGRDDNGNKKVIKKKQGIERLRIVTRGLFDLMKQKKSR